MQSLNWVQRLADGADLMGETLPYVPIVEIAGDKRVLIEHHKGMTEYSRERICVKVHYGIVCICGCGLRLSQMTREQLVVSGQIDGIQLYRRCPNERL